MSKRSIFTATLSATFHDRPGGQQNVLGENTGERSGGVCAGETALGQRARLPGLRR